MLSANQACAVSSSECMGRIGRQWEVRKRPFVVKLSSTDSAFNQGKPRMKPIITFSPAVARLHEKTLAVKRLA